MGLIYMQSWKQCAFPLINTIALWQLMHLGTWCYTLLVTTNHRVFNYASCLSSWALFGSLVRATCNRTSCAQVHDLPRASSQTTKKNSTIICLGITPPKIQKSHATLRQGNSREKRRVSTDTSATRPKIHRKRVQQKTLHPENRQNHHTSRITKELVNQFAT